MRALLAFVLALGLTGCGHAGLPTGATAVKTAGAVAQGKVLPQGNAKAQAAALDLQLRELFHANFNALDTNVNGLITASDLDASDARFHTALGKYDANHDGAVTYSEYYSTARAKAMLSSVQARATVSAMGVGGRVTRDKVHLVFDVYLNDRITDAAERAGAIDDAFEAADTDHSKFLAEPELEVALAILEALADLRQIQHQLGAPDPTP